MTAPVRPRRTEPLRARRTPTPTPPASQWTPSPPPCQADGHAPLPDNKNKVTAAKWIAGGIAVILAIGVLTGGPSMISSADEDTSIPEGVMVGNQHSPTIQRVTDQNICELINDKFDDDDIVGLIALAKAPDVASPRIEEALDDVADTMLEAVAGDTPSSSKIESIAKEMFNACLAVGWTP